VAGWLGFARENASAWFGVLFRENLMFREASMNETLYRIVSWGFQELLWGGD